MKLRELRARLERDERLSQARQAIPLRQPGEPLEVAARFGTAGWYALGWALTLLLNAAGLGIVAALATWNVSMGVGTWVYFMVLFTLFAVPILLVAAVVIGWVGPFNRRRGFRVGVETATLEWCALALAAPALIPFAIVGVACTLPISRRL